MGSYVLYADSLECSCAEALSISIVHLSLPFEPSINQLILTWFEPAILLPKCQQLGRRHDFNVLCTSMNFPFQYADRLILRDRLPAPTKIILFCSNIFLLNQISTSHLPAEHSEYNLVSEEKQ